mmetsp:Transcript_170812/g.542770  ORF Transcript_170812/g.542770 Transcript_170812/m.542770 type:complete len:279 (+) Transcript_170812:471-1307(+)
MLFEQAGGRIVRAVVDSMDFDHATLCEGSPLLRAQLRSGETLMGRRALVCAGALTCWQRLLPSDAGHLRLESKVVTQEVVRVAVGEADLARLAAMPCMVFKFGSAPFGTATGFDSCYVLPPVPYPAEPGQKETHFLKIGHGAWFECPLTGPEAARSWMSGEAGANVRDGVGASEALCGMLEDLFPGLLGRAREVVVDRCMWDVTPGMRPFVDVLPGGHVGVCGGGNGFAAKSSDELGRVAALMMIGDLEDTGWSYDIPRETFTAVFAPSDEVGNESLG